MSNSPQPIHSLDDLRNYVHATLSFHDQLEVGAFKMTERILVQHGKPCGLFFCLHGPRAAKVFAIWETLRNTVLFYSSSGERFQRTQLMGSVASELIAA